MIINHRQVERGLRNLSCRVISDIEMLHQHFYSGWNLGEPLVCLELKLTMRIWSLKRGCIRVRHWFGVSSEYSDRLAPPVWLLRFLYAATPVSFEATRNSSGWQLKVLPENENEHYLLDEHITWRRLFGAAP